MLSEIAEIFIIFLVILVILIVVGLITIGANYILIDNYSIAYLNETSKKYKLVPILLIVLLLAFAHYMIVVRSSQNLLDALCYGYIIGLLTYGIVALSKLVYPYKDFIVIYNKKPISNTTSSDGNSKPNLETINVSIDEDNAPMLIVGVINGMLLNGIIALIVYSIFNKNNQKI